MKHIATFAIVSFMALFSQSNARASICNRAYNNLSDRFSDNTNKQFEPDSVVERKVLEEGDTVYRYMPKPVDLGPIINQTPSKSPKKRALRASRPNDFGVPKFDNYAQGNRYVGRIAIQEGVSPSGAKTYSIPLTTANCCGTAPQMAITYSSQAANGAAGYGWNVSGASAIMAVGKSIMFDGVTASADLTQPDECRFALDGVRLVDNTGGLSQYQYVTSRGSTLMKKHCYGAHVAYFTVAYPNGSTATFGFKDNATTRYLYPLTEICYSNGYRMNFTYEESGNCYYLSKVAYGGKTEHDHTGLLLFSYANRTDCTEAFVAGIGIKPNKLLKGVVSQTKVNGKFETLCSYKLTHVERGVNLLTQLDCVSDDAALPPLQFAYGEGEDATQARLVESSQLLLTKYFANDSNTKKPIYLRGKLVKNNYADGLLAMPGHFHQYQKTGERVITKFFVKQRYAIFGSGYPTDQDILIAPGLALLSNVTTIKTGSGFQTIQAVDTDGDGIDELVKVNFGDLIGGHTHLKITKYRYEEGKFTSQSFTAPAMGVVDNHGKTYSPMSRIYLFGDFRGKGKAQLLTITHNKTFLDDDIPSFFTLIDLGEERSVSETSLFSMSFDSKVFAMDVDGDGKAELCHATADGMDVYGYSDGDSKFVKRFKSAEITDKNIENATFGDVNGDGKIDLMLPPKDSYEQYAKQTIPVWSPLSCFKCGRKTPIIGLGYRCVQCYTDLRSKQGNVCRGCGMGLYSSTDPWGYVRLICPTHGATVETMVPSGYVDNGKIWTALISTGRGFAKRQMPIVNREMWDKYLMMDVDKNGLADLLCTRDGNTRLFLNVNGKLQETACCNFSLSQNTQLLPANVNNPWGMSQLVTISNAVVSCYNFTTDENSNRMLTGMADSYGLLQHNRYEDMTAEWSNYVPSRSTYAYPYFNFMAPLRLLSSSITYSGREMLKHLRYTYSGAVAHRTGFGFVGFENTRVDEGMSENYTKERHDPEHLGVTTHIETREKDVYMSYANAFLAPNKTCNPLLMSLTEDFKLTGVWKETLFRYDEFNNLTQQRTSFDEDNLYTEEGQSYRNIVTPERYQLGLPLTKTTTSGRNGSTWTTREEITYNAEWRPERQTTYINGNKTGETHWTYDAHGNMASEKSVPYNVTELLGNTYTYDASGRNLLTKTNALGQTTTFADYDKWGQPHRIIDHKGKATTIVTDAWGKPTSTTSPDGVTATTTTAWGGKELYTIAKSVTGQPDVIVHCDALGREVRKGNRRFDGKWQFVDNVYDVKGRLEKTSLPFKGDAPTLWATYEYDEYDRPVKFTEASGKATTWSYAELSVTETKGGIATTKTTDASGALIKVEDPGGTITYALRPDGQPSAITAPGNVTTTFEYDNFGRRTAIVDPSAGRRTFSESYNADGKRTVVETNADGKSITTLYDKYGRATETSRREFNTTYTYTDDGLLAGEISSNGTSKEYYYDDYGRLARSRENALDGKYLQKQFQYDKGNVSAVSYRSASGFLCEERYEYANGHNVEIKLQDGRKVWKLTEENDLGQAQKVQSGVVERNYGYSETGLPSICRYNNIIPYSIYYTDFGFNYEFDAQTNNLLSRTNCRYKHAEYFSYDNLNRLTRMSYYAGDSLVAYAANGNIVQKRNVGTMSYANAARPYQLTSVTPSDTSIPLRDQRISYTSFMCPERIEEKGYVAKFDYNAAADRVRMNVTHGAQNVLTRHYIGNQYECDIDSFGEITERLYLGGDAYSAPAVFIRHENEGGNVYQIIRDYLGSVVYVTDDNGYLKQELEYDAWGRLRSPSYIEYYKEGEEPTLLLGRGYCGHEHLPWFGLINMNARLYDPVLGRFLSPDPYVQMPDFTQSFNRYSYCLNNPLKYVDKDGKFAWFIPVLVGAVIGAYSGAVIANDGEYNPAKWDFHSGKTWRYMLGGAVVGGASGYIGGAIAASGIPLANTASIAAASLINSFGTWAYTGGQTPISVSIGFASYNFSDGTFGFLGKKGNLGIQTLGYVLGALNNLADIGKTGYLLLNTEKKDLINHSAIREMDGKTIISIGPGKEWIVPKGSVDHYLNRFLGANGATNRYPVKGVDTIIRHVNTSTIKTYGRMLDVLTKEGRGILPYSFLYSSCSTHTGLALNLAGIPTLFIHPYTVLGSIWLWNIGITPALINNSFHFQTR